MTIIIQQVGYYVFDRFLFIFCAVQSYSEAEQMYTIDILICNKTQSSF